MVEGELVALDRPAALKAHHVPGLLLKVEGKAVARALELARGLRGVLAAQPFGAAAHVRVDPQQQDAERLQAAFQGAGIQGVSVEVTEPTLEDVFLAVVGAN
jgi:hypothetical protein